MSDERIGGQPVVFLGSTLPVAEARAILDAEFRPPVKRGDIDALLADPPPAIGIIDGEFFQSLAISPKEILRAIERGVAVFGASSMGALRAVELDPYGMTGVGTVFERYRSGEIDADDEVAVAFSLEEYRPLSEAMINIRIAISAAATAGVITDRQSKRLVVMAKRMYFPERSYASLWRKAEGRLPEATLAALRAYLAEHQPDAKRDDARLMLRRMAERERVAF
jgi:hypothetical protein